MVLCSIMFLGVRVYRLLVLLIGWMWVSSVVLLILKWEVGGVIVWCRLIIDICCMWCSGGILCD